VCFDLADRTVDIILLTEPRGNLRISAYSDKAISRHLLRANPNALVVHRINDSDERQGTGGVTRRLARANRVADYTVYVSRWLKDIYESQGLSGPSAVIHNGADRKVFHPGGHRRWNGNEPLRLVTHHWSPNERKGFDVYARLDNLASVQPLRRRFQFTYVGRLPKSFRFRHATHLPACAPPDVAQELRRHHVYLTASQHEPGANHPIEGARCGLPLLYRESGSLPEYCRGFGVSFRPESFVEALADMMDTYDAWAARMDAYPHTSDRMGDEYFNLFERLLDRRQEILERRETDPRVLVRAFLPELPLQRTLSGALQWVRHTTGCRR
jgi:hypothetical protein